MRFFVILEKKKKKKLNPNVQKQESCTFFKLSILRSKTKQRQVLHV